MPETIAAPPPAPTPLPPSAAAPAIVDAAQLLSGAGEILIRHAGQHYRLRVTRANKLILTK
ncbi:hemin uptake protein HemP [Azospirillum thermophilum]|uniref:Hemin uptake protein HemP n=1 Tax=Azospirillum thermophilum TaxID=2202148 RepID=A0A2S2CLP7_9PROT|nr:hemin uptake protein HemP [Azospirillum thermophilum]AWK85392.1 hemin uptake protein HemP [Azospirillum thermophilum]